MSPVSCKNNAAEIKAYDLILICADIDSPKKITSGLILTMHSRGGIDSTGETFQKIVVDGCKSSGTAPTERIVIKND